MAFKSFYAGTDDREPSRIIPARQDVGLIARVGICERGKPSSEGSREHNERIIRIDDNILGYNLNGKMCLIRAKKNDREFDCYLAMPFTKGVTERLTGRTMLILGSNAHHGDAMRGQFEGVIWNPELEEESKRYGNTVRWINVGNLREGFIGFDYNPGASFNAGVATSIEDIKFLASALLEFGYDPKKKLFLLKPPYIQESEYGKRIREKGYRNLGDFAKYGGKK